jgi:hypothetical protein
MADKLKRTLIAGAGVAALASGGAAIAGASGRQDPSSPITGGALDRAKAAALDRIGGGRVTGTEVRDEEGYYEVEVRRDDGNRFDVHLDAGFNVLDASPDRPCERRDANRR